MTAEWLVNRKSELCRRGGNFQLSYRSLVVAMHEHMFVCGPDGTLAPPHPQVISLA
jgi:hypothetical protein